MKIQLQALPNLTSLLCQGTSRNNEVYAVSKWTDLFGIILPMKIQVQALPNLTSLLCQGTSRKNEVYAVSKWTDLFGVIFPNENSITSSSQFDLSSLSRHK